MVLTFNFSTIVALAHNDSAMCSLGIKNTALSNYKKVN